MKLEPKAGQLRPFIRAKDTPSVGLTLLYGFQQVMVCVSALLTVPILLADAVCPGVHTGDLRNELITATFFSSGVSTIIQTVFGMRLALLQGTAFAYLPIVQNFMKTEFSCNHALNNVSMLTNRDEVNERMTMIQGSLLISSIIPMLMGLTGIVGALTKFVGPLTVSPLMLLLAFSQTESMMEKMGRHWVSLVQVLALFATIMYLAEIKVRLPGLKKGKFHWYRVNVFGQYPYLIAIIFTWAVCVFLTVTGLSAPESEPRVDKAKNLLIIHESAWISAPRPFRYGAPMIAGSLLVGFLVSALTSVLESVGDYQTAARMSLERPPPSHAVNRGILAEGMGSFVSSIFGPGVGMTTHTENIGVIGVTRVASRTTMVVAGIFLILLGLCTKVGAILSTIPDALVGGILASSMAMVVGVAVTNLSTVDMNLPRNMAIFGFSMMFGLIIPEYFTKYPVNTGWEQFDHFAEILLTLQMFIGAVCACFLDNTVPGATRTQRGLRERGEVFESASGEADTYLYPALIMKIFDKISFARFIPCLPKEKRVTNKVQPTPEGDTRL